MRLSLRLGADAFALILATEPLEIEPSALPARFWNDGLGRGQKKVAVIT